MAAPRMKAKEKEEVVSSGSEKVSVLDDEIEAEIKRWKSLSKNVQRDRLAPVVESFGVGGP